MNWDDISSLPIIRDFTFNKGDIKNQCKWKDHMGGSVLKHVDVIPSGPDAFPFFKDLMIFRTS